MLLHPTPCGPGQLCTVGDKILYRTVQLDEFRRRLLADAGATGYIVGDVAFKRKQIDDLPRTLYAVALAHFSGPSYLESFSAQRRPIHPDAVSHKLAVILVGSHHIGVVSVFVGHLCQSAYDVVGLVAVYFHHRNVHGIEYPFDPWH